MVRQDNITPIVFTDRMGQGPIWDWFKTSFVNLWDFICRLPDRLFVQTPLAFVNSLSLDAGIGTGYGLAIDAGVFGFEALFGIANLLHIKFSSSSFDIGTFCRNSASISFLIFGLSTSNEMWNSYLDKANNYEKKGFEPSISVGISFYFVVGFSIEVDFDYICFWENLVKIWTI